MKTLVTGGRGTLGRLLVPRLEAAGHDVVITSRNTQGGGIRRLDLAKSKTIAEAVAGIDTIVHAASNPARATAVDVRGTEALLRAAHAAGIGHFVYLSIVGIDDHPFPYYRAKKAAEAAIEASPVPSTILRATQFHQFLSRIFDTGPVITVFPGFEFQVIDSGVVADRLVELAAAGPSGRVADLGGPRSESMKDMAASWKQATGCRHPRVSIPVFGKTARAFRQKLHHTPNAAVDTPTWSDWLDGLRGDTS